MVLQQGMKLPVWGTADDGEKVTVEVLQPLRPVEEAGIALGQSVSTIARDGKWMVTLAPLQAGGPGQIKIKGPENEITIHNVLVGEVWVCSGQSNMAMTVNRCENAEAEIADSANNRIRLMTVPRKAADEPQRDFEGAWKVCGPDTVGGFSAAGYFFGRELEKQLGVPVGLINTSYGGTPAEAWTSRQKLASEPKLKPILDAFAAICQRYPESRRRYEAALAKWKQRAAELRKEGKRPPRAPQPPMGPDHPKRPGGLYYAMISPLQPYAIRGAIWYQGEANAGRAYQYRTLFSAMIECWREDWGQGDFPFLFVQLAPYMKIVEEPADSAWAELREAQLMTSERVPNTAMAVITDGGEQLDIHPKKKQIPGKRLALAALALAYGKDVDYLGPRLEAMQIEGAKAILTFDHVGDGLACKGDELTGFAICGADRKFFNAEAKIVGRDKVEVSSPQVDKPVAVRFGWANYPVVNFYNRSGLPASPFRTDDFPGVTAPK